MVPAPVTTIILPPLLVLMSPLHHSHPLSIPCAPCLISPSKLHLPWPRVPSPYHTVSFIPSIFLTAWAPSPLVSLISMLPGPHFFSPLLTLTHISFLPIFSSRSFESSLFLLLLAFEYFLCSPLVIGLFHSSSFSIH